MVLSTNLDGAVKRWSCQKMELFTILDGDVKGWCCLQIWMVPVMVPSIILDGAVYKFGWCNQMMMMPMDGAVNNFG